MGLGVGWRGDGFVWDVSRVRHVLVSKSYTQTLSLDPCSIAVSFAI